MVFEQKKYIFNEFLSLIFEYEIKSLSSMPLGIIFKWLFSFYFINMTKGDFAWNRPRLGGGFFRR